MKRLFNNTLDFSRLYSMVALKRGLLLLMFLFSVPTFAQDCVTKFMGIPVDGTKEEMVSALQKKGFKKVDSDMLVGEFNGQESTVVIATNKGKVYCVAAAYLGLDDIVVVRTFNNIFNMLKNNSRYSYIDGEQISDGEDVEYKINVRNQLYEAYFNQIGSCSDEVSSPNRLVRVFVSRAGYRRFSVSIGYYNMNNYPSGEDL